MARKHWSCWDEEPEEPEVIEPEPPTVEEDMCVAWGCNCWGSPYWGCFTNAKPTPYPPRINAIKIMPHTLVELYIMRG